jgi:hypothetical protein
MPGSLPCLPQPDPSRPHPFAQVWEEGLYVPVAPILEFVPGNSPLDDNSFMLVGFLSKRLYIPGSFDCSLAGVLASHSCEFHSALASKNVKRISVKIHCQF